MSYLSTNNQVDIIRCGIWKPRTRPGGFEGIGEEGLKWIKDYKKEFPNINFAIEVAQPTHIELCLKYNIDVIWIGARTSSNPFSMNELSECLKGINIPVMIKNPPIPDVKLWIGAIERIKNTGIKDIAAIHRGFFTHNNYGFRNNPLWEIPIEIKRTHPDLPLICDPSHISGNSSIVQSIAQSAMDLNFDGLMIEVHPYPSKALTDKEQQLTPSEFEILLNNLVIRKNIDTTPIELDLLRKKIDMLDFELLSILSQRIDVSKQIASIKAKQGQTVLLSPASASFDEFTSYEERGDRFVEIVRGFETRRLAKGAHTGDGEHSNAVVDTSEGIVEGESE
jgi:chorismate mutase